MLCTGFCGRGRKIQDSAAHSINWGGDNGIRAKIIVVTLWVALVFLCPSSEHKSSATLPVHTLDKTPQDGEDSLYPVVV